MKSTHEFYIEAIQLMQQNNIRFLVGGAWSLKIHTGISRDTKDLDIFCTSDAYPAILKLFDKNGYKTELRDARWLAKAFKEDYFIDFIFNSLNNLCPVDETWFDHSISDELFGIPVHYVSAEELFWNKIYVMNRDRYDGADLNHIILKKGKEMNWRWILEKMNPHWQLLFSQLLNFQFVYPSERDKIPNWLFDELITRSKDQYETPLSTVKICRGKLIEHSAYNIDTEEWGYIS